MAADNGDPIPNVPIGVYSPAHPRSSAWVKRRVAESIAV